MGSQALADTSSLRLYLHEVGITPLLTADDESRLAGRVAEGDAEARDLMVRSNLRLVVEIARHYAGRGLPMEDLIAEGNLGLLRAVEGFDSTRGHRFCTYASYWIKQSIRSALIKQGKVFRLPAYLVVLLGKWRRAAAALADHLHREPTHDEVAQALRLSVRRRKAVGMALEISRLNASHEGGGGGEGVLPMEESLVDRRGRLPEEQVEEIDTLTRIFDRLDELDPRQREVIQLRFGLGSGTSMTLREVGAHLGLTRERVRQLEQHALRTLLKSVD
jgi:RNA polymerase primary sigma factor